ncbi:MAG: cytochrome c3 family protein, partial [Planctomycetes bacterium]|nr:cytochrome c3 family protein [Planctomycetota bacterium]
PRDCAGCHDNPHGRQIDDASGTPRTCTSCHTEDAFHPSTLERDDHASFSGFELRGAHEKLACEACHEPRHLDVRQGIFYSVQLKNVGRSCVDCHTSPHGNQFSSEDGNGCARCHDQEAFLPAHFGLEEHARSSFPLDGAHTATACSSCHPVLPRPTHFVPFRGTPQACASCHPDTHGGRFDHAGRVGDCARCHTTNDFSVGERFEHGKETGFALTGAHEKPRCEACHPRQAEDVTGRTFGRATTTCASCHPDPHAGQFATLSVTDCERCHTTERTWSPTRFDHAQSQFPLDERHRDLECSVCHKPWKLSSGASVTRYRPLGTTCSDCHGGRRKG